MSIFWHSIGNLSGGSATESAFTNVSWHSDIGQQLMVIAQITEVDGVLVTPSWLVELTFADKIEPIISCCLLPYSTNRNDEIGLRQFRWFVLLSFIVLNTGLYLSYCHVCTMYMTHFFILYPMLMLTLLIVLQWLYLWLISSQFNSHDRTTNDVHIYDTLHELTSYKT